MGTPLSSLPQQTKTMKLYTLFLSAPHEIAELYVLACHDYDAICQLPEEYQEPQWRVDRIVESNGFYNEDGTTHLPRFVTDR